MSRRLLAAVDERTALDGLAARPVNYDPARAPQDGVPEGHWHVDSSTAMIGREPPGPPVPGGPWEVACRLVREYEFADARILRGVYRRDAGLLGRNMLLEGRFFGLRFYLGVRVTRVIDERRAAPDGEEQVWGWSYQTLQGHLEQGRLSYEVIKNLATGEVAFRVTGYSRRGPIPDPVVRWGFRAFGRWTQQRFYRNILRRMADLTARAGRGEPLPTPAVRTDGLVVAPSGVSPHPAERFVRSWLHPGR
jgi:uncharacterized protein (UPF0548 family)